MDSGTAKERAKGEERKMSNIDDSDSTKQLSFTDRLKRICETKFEMAQEDRPFFEQSEEVFKRWAKENEKHGENSFDELKKQYFYLQSEIYNLHSLISQIMLVILGEDEKKWRMFLFMLDAFQLDISKQNDETKKEFLNDLKQLESKYDISHNGILAHLADLRKTNNWFSQGEEKSETT